MTATVPQSDVMPIEPASSQDEATTERVLTRQLAGQSALLMMGNAFTFAAGFPFQIYLATVLGADKLGAYGLFEVIVQTMAGLFGLGLGEVAVRFLPQYLAEGQSAHIRYLLRTVYGLTLLLSLLAIVVFLTGGPLFGLGSQNIQAYRGVMMLMALMIPIGMMLATSQQVLRGFFDVRYVVLTTSILQLTLKIGFCVLFFWFGMQLFGYALAVVLSSAISLMGMLVGIFRHLRKLPVSAEFNKASERSAWIKYGKVMYGNSLVGLACAPLERVLLATVIDLKAVGVLMVIRQLQSFPQIFLQIIIVVVAPMFVTAKRLKDVSHLYHLATDWLCRLAFPLSVFLLLRSSSVLALYGVDFSQLGTAALVVVLLTQSVNLGCGPIGNLLNMRGHQAAMFRINIVSIVLLLLGTVILVPWLGLLGAALATTISTITANLWALWLARRTLSIHWMSRRYIRWIYPVCATMAALCLLGLVPGVEGKWWLCLEFAASVSVFHLVYFAGGLCDEDREVISIFKHRLFKKVSREGEPIHLEIGAPDR